jgi:hypothetical protein
MMKNKLSRFVLWILAVPSIIGLALWAALALWYTLPVPELVRYVLVFILAGLAVGGLLAIAMKQKFLVATAPFIFALAATLIWWSTISPSNNRNWQEDVAKLPSAEINGSFVTLRNVRNFKYRSEIDYSPDWYDKIYDLRKLESLDLIAVYWMGDAIAHTMLSFNFGGEFVVISIEIRKEKGESFSALAGFFRRYELTYIVGDERDLIGLRTTHRNPPEDVYLYRVKARHKENVGKLFLRYIAKINSLHSKPEFYNTATTNCTTNIVTHVEAARGSVPLSWKMLLSGYFPELFYERGVLDRSLPFEELRAKSKINQRAVAADGSNNYSAAIRQGLIGMSSMPNSKKINQ